jgi:NhaP-type Na+/H+ or K+/H+ antiporter
MVSTLEKSLWGSLFTLINQLFLVNSEIMLERGQANPLLFKRAYIYPKNHIQKYFSKIFVLKKVFDQYFILRYRIGQESLYHYM